MSNVCNKETVGISFVAGHTDGVTSCCCCRGVIYPEVDLAIVGVDEALARSCGLGLVAHKSMGRVRSRVEIE